MEATDRWNAVITHHAVTEQLRSKLWETELQVGLHGSMFVPTGQPTICGAHVQHFRV